MASLYAVLREQHPPTAAHLCATGSFRNPDEVNLIVAKASSIEVYALPKEDGGVAEGGAAGILQLVGRYDLCGVVEAMALVKFPNRERAMLLLAFREAKLSVRPVVEYDPAVDNVFTSCIHSFEAEELKGGRINFARAPVLKVDPALRCAAMLVYERKLVVIPFRQTGTEMDDEDDEIVAPSKKARTDAQGTATAGSGAVTRLGAKPSDPKSPFLPSYMIDLEMHGMCGA
ncbi:hypothetical protein T484DRAFT_1777842 [Baffinella frigidus]|nr:hypothetical protein T484DRAFT_1777842 [Cryptophyta sp. CCMP2293]